MQEPNNTDTTALSEPEVKIRRHLKWSYTLRDKLSDEQRDVFDRFVKARGNAFGSTEAFILERIRWDRENIVHKGLALLIGHFEQRGWSKGGRGASMIREKLVGCEREAKKAAVLATLPRERREQYHPERFIAYRHRKPGHT